MAVVHRDFLSGQGNTQRNENSMRKSYWMLTVVGICSFFGGSYLGNLGFSVLPYVFWLIAVLCVALCYSKFKTYQKNKDIFASGDEGESLAIAYLEVLDRNFHIIPNAVLKYGEKRSEMDTIVIGPTGVFIIEVKNYKGIIEGNMSDHNLKQTKPDNYGKMFTKTFYNPCKQVATHRYTLNGVLRVSGISTYINICVFFANKDAQLSVNNDNNSDCKIFQDYSKLVNYIKSGKNSLPEDRVRDIINCIVSQSKS